MTHSNLCIDRLFRDARTHNAWLDKPVSDETLREIYNALKWGPTSANASPARFVFIRTAKNKERLRPSLAPGNVEKTMAAPVTVIVAYDLQFYEKLPKLFPHNPGMRDLFTANPALVEVTARRNSSLQGAYLMLAARARGRNAKAASRSSFRRDTLSRTSCAISVTEIHQSSWHAVRAWNSTRHARSCEVLPVRFTPHDNMQLDQLKRFAVDADLRLR